MSKDTFCPDEFMNGLYDALYKSPFSAVTDRASVEAAAESTSAHLRRILNIDGIPCKLNTPPDTVVSEADYGEYTQSKMKIELCKGLTMPFFLLRPKKPTGGGVVAVCGHGFGARQIVQSGKNGRKKPFATRDYQKNFAIELCKRGNVVVVPEPIGFGEMRLKKQIKLPFYANSCRDISRKAIACGFSAVSLRVYQVLRCLDILVQNGAEEGKLGCMGISGGGLVALYSACLDKRISRTVVSGYVNTYPTSIFARWHCPDNYIPGMLSVGESYDIASAIFPRGLLLECGKQDALFTIDGSLKAIENITRVYAIGGEAQAFSADVFDGKHQISGSLSYDFLTRKEGQE